MGTPDGMGYIALFCISILPAALLAFLAVSAVRAYKAGDKMLAMMDAIVFLILFVLIAAAVLMYFFA